MLVAAVGLLTACGGSGSDAAMLPDVEVEALVGGSTISLASIEGPAVVNLWATSCAPCRAEIPAFESVHQARGDTVRFVGLNIGESADQAAVFIDEVGATYEQYLDQLGYAVTELDVSAMPTTIVIDAVGHIATRHIGPMDVTDLNDAIDAALAGSSAG